VARLFDAYIIADWTAAEGKKLGDTSLWLGVAKRDVRFRLYTETHNVATRAEGEALLASLLAEHRKRGDRVLVRDSVSVVKMKRLSDAELNAYLASGEWQGKAGGYGIQGLAGALIPWISGSFTGIMGLPVAETAALLTAIGYPVWRQE